MIRIIPVDRRGDLVNQRKQLAGAHCAVAVP